jgi:hypothetical protein
MRLDVEKLSLVTLGEALTGRSRQAELACRIKPAEVRLEGEHQRK